MTPKQIIDNFIQKQDIYESVGITEFGFTEEQIIQMMKEYATLCCEAQKIACAENKTEAYREIGKNETWEYTKVISKDSVLNTPITLL